MRRTEYLSELMQDVTFAVPPARSAAPASRAIAVLTLALGIGATTAIFSAVQSVVLRPLPFSHPERIVAVYEQVRGQPRQRLRRQLRRRHRARRPRSRRRRRCSIRASTSPASGDAERIIGARVTAGFFDVFDIPAERGRVFTTDEDQPGREQVVVLSHRLWARRFGGDPSIVGRQITLNGRPYDVIGVMPPRSTTRRTARSCGCRSRSRPSGRRRTTSTTSRSTPGCAKAPPPTKRARPSCSPRASRSAKRSRATRRICRLRPSTPLDDLVGDYRRRLFMLLGAVGFVLLIACGNVANLLLARGAARAGSWRSAPRSAPGAAASSASCSPRASCWPASPRRSGLALAAWGVSALIAAAPAGVPRLEQTRSISWCWRSRWAWRWSARCSSALRRRCARPKPTCIAVLKEGGRGAGMGGLRDRLRTGLIVAELAVALVLLVGAGLLIRSSLALQRVDPGFDPARRLLGAASRCRPPPTPIARRVVQTFERLAQAAAAIPGAASAAITTQVPMGAGGNGNGLVPEGKPFDGRRISIGSRLRMVTPATSTTMGIPIVRGRALHRRRSPRGAEGDGRQRGARGRRPSPTRIRSAGGSPAARREPTARRRTTRSWSASRATSVRAAWAKRRPPSSISRSIRCPPKAWDWIQRTVYIVVRTQPGPDDDGQPAARGRRAASPPACRCFSSGRWSSGCGNRRQRRGSTRCC